MCWPKYIISRGGVQIGINPKSQTPTEYFTDQMRTCYLIAFLRVISPRALDQNSLKKAPIGLQAAMHALRM